MHPFTSSVFQGDYIGGYLRFQQVMSMVCLLLYWSGSLFTEPKTKWLLTCDMWQIESKFGLTPADQQPANIRSTSGRVVKTTPAFFFGHRGLAPRLGWSLGCLRVAWSDNGRRGSQAGFWGTTCQASVIHHAKQKHGSIIKCHNTSWNAKVEGPFEQQWEYPSPLAKRV